MIAYAESNFILELATLQEEHASCNAILDLAESGRISLVIPAFSVAEPYDVLRRRSNDRRRLQDEVAKQLRLVSRTEVNEQQHQNAADVTAMLIESGNQEAARLHDVLVQLVTIAEMIPITATVLRDALQAQDRLGLKPQDSIVYASVMAHASAASGEKYFLNRDAKDFLTPDIEEQFRSVGCTLVSSFSGGLRRIQADLD
jgi:predicted nucleic acid-binding protein